jgi:hypothetical protein
MLGKIIDGESDLVRGDWVYFQNWVTANNCPSINPLQGENAICQNSSEGAASDYRARYYG